MQRRSAAHELQARLDPLGLLVLRNRELGGMALAHDLFAELDGRHPSMTIGDRTSGGRSEGSPLQAVPFPFMTGLLLESRYHECRRSGV